MKNKEIYSTLYDCCRWNSPESIKETLERTEKEFDLTQDKGQLFHIAISNGFADVLKILLEYYEKNKFQIDFYKLQGGGYNLEYANYLNEKNKLHKILEKAHNSAFTISPEIETILNKYGIPKSDYSEEESDLEDSNNVISETTETNESNEISSSFEDLNLVGTEEIKFDNLSHQ